MQIILELEINLDVGQTIRDSKLHNDHYDADSGEGVHFPVTITD
jgi:hypothetical protein